MILLACEMSAILRQFEHSLALPFFGIGMKTPFPIWNQSVVLCPVLLLLDLHTDFSGGKSGGLVFPSLEEFSSLWTVIHTVKGFGIVSKAEVDIFAGTLLLF